MSHHLPLITVSELKCFRRCPRERHIAYGLGYRPVKDAEALWFGRLLHVGLEAWWLSRPPGELRLSVALTAMTVARAADQDVDPFAVVKAEELLRGYSFRWEDESLEPVVIEQEFRAPIVNPDTGAVSRTFELGGKVDGIVRRGSSVLLLEHKTSSEDIGLGSVYWERLRLDSQISVYYEGARQLGYDVEGCIYDVVKKPGIRPSAVSLTDADGVKVVLDSAGARVRTKDGKKWRESGDAAQGYVLQTRTETPDEYRARLRADIAENPDRYYQRGTVVRLEQEMKDAQADTWATARSIRDAQLSGRWARNTDGCQRFGRLCSYFPVCTGAASLDDPTKYRQTDTPHEELAHAS